MSTAYCLFCKEPIRTDCDYNLGGTYWTHFDGYRDCKPTFAAPDGKWDTIPDPY